jgi:hypothetical protein
MWLPPRRKLDSEDDLELFVRDHLGDPLACGEDIGAIHGVTRPGAWPLQGAPTRTSGKRGASRYFGKSTGVVDRNLHLHLN